MSAVREDMLTELERFGWFPSEDKDDRLAARIKEKHNFPSVKKIPLSIFFSDENIIESHKPVVVSVVYEDDQYFATNDSLNIFAIGDGLDSAITDFLHHVVYFHGFYTSKSLDECVGDALRLKQLYDQFTVTG